MIFTIDLHHMDFVFPTNIHYGKCVDTSIGYTSKIFVFLKFLNPYHKLSNHTIVKIIFLVYEL